MNNNLGIIFDKGIKLSKSCTAYKVYEYWREHILKKQCPEGMDTFLGSLSIVQKKILEFYIQMYKDKKDIIFLCTENNNCKTTNKLKKKTRNSLSKLSERMKLDALKKNSFCKETISVYFKMLFIIRKNDFDSYLKKYSNIDKNKLYTEYNNLIDKFVENILNKNSIIKYEKKISYDINNLKFVNKGNKQNNQVNNHIINGNQEHKEITYTNKHQDVQSKIYLKNNKNVTNQRNSHENKIDPIKKLESNLINLKKEELLNILFDKRKELYYTWKVLKIAQKKINHSSKSSGFCSISELKSKKYMCKKASFLYKGEASSSINKTKFNQEFKNVNNNQNIITQIICIEGDLEVLKQIINTRYNSYQIKHMITNLKQQKNNSEYQKIELVSLGGKKNKKPTQLQKIKLLHKNQIQKIKLKQKKEVEKLKIKQNKELKKCK